MAATFPQNWRDFNGTVPRLVFPEVALFPYAVRPFRLTEPDALVAVETAMVGEQLVVTTTQFDPLQLETGNVGCLARISVIQPLADGGAIVLLRGLGRAALEGPAFTTEPGDWWQVQAIQERYPSPPAIQRELRRQELLTAFLACREHRPLPASDAALSHQLSLGCLCDVLAQAMEWPNSISLELLQTVNVDYRSDLLLDALRAALRMERDYPPKFSAN